MWAVLILGLVVRAGDVRADIQVGEIYSGPGFEIRVAGLRECVSSSSKNGVMGKASAWSCQARDSFHGVLSVIDIGVSSGSLTAFCLGASLPVSASIAGAALAFKIVDLVVQSSDCDASDSEEQIKEWVDGQVCEALERNGILCNPAAL